MLKYKCAFPEDNLLYMYVIIVIVESAKPAACKRNFENQKLGKTIISDWF